MSLTYKQQQPLLFQSFRKEVIQPHLPIRLPCYDFTPVTGPAFDGSFQAVIATDDSRICLFICAAASSLAPYIASCYARRNLLASPQMPCASASVIRSEDRSVQPPASGISDSHGVTGGVYKTRERIHRDILIRDY